MRAILQNASSSQTYNFIQGFDRKTWEETLKGQLRDPLLESRAYLDVCHYDINVEGGTFVGVMTNLAYDLPFPIPAGTILSSTDNTAWPLGILFSITKNLVKS